MFSIVVLIISLQHLVSHLGQGPLMLGAAQTCPAPWHVRTTPWLHLLASTWKSLSLDFSSLGPLEDWGPVTSGFECCNYVCLPDCVLHIYPLARVNCFCYLEKIHPNVQMLVSQTWKWKRICLLIWNLRPQLCFHFVMKVRSLFLTAKLGLTDVCWGSSVWLWVHPEDLTKMFRIILGHQMWLCFLNWVSVT